MLTAAYWRRRGFHVSCVRTKLNNLFSCFGKHFDLIMSYFICRNLTLPLLLLFFNKISLCCHETSLFYLKLFLRTKVSQKDFNFNEIEFKLCSIFKYDTLLWKNLLTGNKVYFIIFILFNKSFNANIYRFYLILLLLLLLLLLNVLAFAIS